MVFELDFEEWFSSYKEDRGRANQTEAWNMQRHGVLLIIFILILIPIPIVKPNTNIPFTEDYYELGAAPSSLLWLLHLNPIKILHSRNYYYHSHLQIRACGWRIHTAGVWENVDSEAHIWPLGYTVLQDVGILAENRGKLTWRVFLLLIGHQRY